MKIQPLTSEQQIIAEENHKLIFSFLKLRNLKKSEYYDIAAIGYCYAISTYDPSIGPLSTYCYHCMNREYHKHLRYLNKQSLIPEDNIISLNESCENKDGSATYLEDLISADFDSEKEAISCVILQNILNKLDEREQHIVNYLELGLTQADIGRKLGVSRNMICIIVKRIRKKICKYLAA